MLKQNPQILYIHGGMTFKTQKEYITYLEERDISLEQKIRWYGAYLTDKLGKRCDIIRPQMPSPDHAIYEHWKITFERYLPFLHKNSILIGQSLGGIFLAKYLSENKLPKKALSVFLICPPFDDSLGGERLAGGFVLPKDLSLLEKNTKHLHLFFSTDDPIVPITHAEKYQHKLKKADIMMFTDKNGHFKIEEFPEIVKVIRAELRA